jgi:putative inorganic carbon (HCO3(-)) transporter
MQACRRPLKGYWIQGALSVTLGLAIGVYLLGLSAADLPTDWFALLIVIGILPFIAVVAGDIKRFLITLIILDTSLSLDKQLFSRPPNSASVDGLWVSLTTISLIILYWLWAAELLTGKARFDLCRSVSLPALGFIAAGLLSVQIAKDPILSVFELALNTEFFLVFLYLANHLQDFDDFRFISHILLVGFLIVALGVVAAYFLGGFHFMGLGGEAAVYRSQRSVRAGGFVSPNVAAMYLAPVSIMALATVLMVSKRGFTRLMALVTLPLGMLALVLTFSRGGWISFAMGGLVFTLLALHRKWLRWQHVILLIAASSLLLFFLREPILRRIFGDDGGNAASRIPLMIIALNMIKAHPWLGVGINNFVIVAPDYLTPETFGAWLAPVHNKYLLVLSETGIVGLLAFILLCLAIGREAWQCYKSDHSVFSALGAALVAGLCGFATHMMVDRFGTRSALQLLWIMAAFASSLHRLSDRRGWVQQLRAGAAVADCRGHRDTQLG